MRDKLAVYLDDAPKPIGIKSVVSCAGACGSTRLVTGETTDYSPRSASRRHGGGVTIGWTVNGIRCSQGTHMESLGKLRDALNEAVAKHTRRCRADDGTGRHLSVVVMARVVNPSFTTQTRS